MSDDDRIFVKKFLNLCQNFCSGRSSFQVSDRQSSDEANDMFEFVSFFIWFNQRLELLFHISVFVKGDDTDLNRFVFGDIEASGFEIESNIFVVFVFCHWIVVNKWYCVGRYTLFSIKIGWDFSSDFCFSFANRNIEVMCLEPSNGFLDFH